MKDGQYSFGNCDPLEDITQQEAGKTISNFHKQCAQTPFGICTVTPPSK